MSDEDGIRSDERERLSARVYELGWCPTCARNLDAAELAAAIMVDPAEVLSPEELAEYERCQQSVIDARRRAPMVEGEIVVGGRVPASSEPRPENPYRADQDVPLGAPSAEEFARRRGDVVQCSRCGQFSPPVPVTDDVAAAWVEAECENERLRAERDEALAALEKIADDERERIVAKLRFFGFPVAATMVEGDA